MQWSPSFLVLALCSVLVRASDAWITPENPLAGEWATIHFDATGGPLATSTHVFIYRGFNHWAQVAAPDQRMTRDAVTGVYAFAFEVPEAAFEINCVFNNGAGTWDNNRTADWRFSVTPAAPAIEIPDRTATLPNASRSGVMMQGFYWDVPAGNWYNTLASKASELRNMFSGHGIDRIWFPPASKGQSGPLSMGYDPYDYYDLGQFFQQGTTRTRFGTQAELKAAIAAFRAEGILSMADIVLNHRSGGAWQTNPITSTGYWTDFSSVASGQCTWDYNDFHPSTYAHSDEGVFAGFPDVSYANPNTPGDPHADMIAWGNWLRNAENAGFEGGWRFDFVKGLPPAILRDFRAETGNPFSVLECWDGIPMIESYVRAGAGASAFDFPGYYTLVDICNNATGGENIANLVDPDRVFAARNPQRAVTFVANHDTDEIIRNRMLAYAFILTFEGYPCLFWRDYFDRGYANYGGRSGNGIRPLVWVRGALAGGDPSIEVLDSTSPDLLVYGTSSGDWEHPGYIIALNDHPGSALSATVQSENKFLHGKTLRCYAWHSEVAVQNVQPEPIECHADGSVTIRAPARGYAVYGPIDIAYPDFGDSPHRYEEGAWALHLQNTRAGESYDIFTTADFSADPWVHAQTLVGSQGDQTALSIEYPAEANLYIRASASSE